MNNEQSGNYGHVTIFAGWANSEHSQYHAYELVWDEGTVYHDIPYPYWPGYGEYFPARYDGVSGDPSPTPTNTPVTGPTSTPIPTPTSAPPSGEGATLCEHENFGRPCGTFTSDDGNLVDEYDDKATSIGIRGPFMATVYEHPNYGGIAETFRHNDSDLRDNPIGSDTITSLRVYPAVALYGDTDFGGKCETFINDDPNLSGNYIGDNRVSSIKVPSGYVAILYEHPNYVEPSEAFTGDDSDLRDNHIGNDTVSSIRVMTSTPTPTPTQTPVSGDVTIDRAYTTDAAGTPKTEFNAGEPIGLHFEVTNQGASFTVICVWQVVHEGAVLYKEVSCDLPTGQSTHSWVPTLPSDAQSGSYQFRGHICSPRFLELYDNYCLIRTADFTVVGPTPTPTSTPSDTTPPTGYFWRPQSGDATNMDSVTIEAQAYDSESGVAAVEFWVWVDEDHWELIDTDIDGWDGWQAIWDVSQISDQTVWFFLRIRDNAGNEVWNPDNSAVSFMIDRVAPTGEIISPAPDSYIHSDQVDIVATASDDRSGVVGLQFFVWYDDGSGYGWHGLPLDWDGSDGWTSVWDTSGAADQDSIGFWTYVFDRAGNMGHYSHGGITLDRIPPCVLLGDFTCDCDVDVQDIQEVASRWRMTDTDPDWDAHYDLNGDGIINVVDIMLVSAHWGETCESLAATLRPSGMKIERPTQPPIPKSIP